MVRFHGVDATVSRVEHLLTDFDSVYRVLRTRSAEVKPALKNTEYDKQGECNYSVLFAYAIFSIAYDSKQVPTSWKVLAKGLPPGQFAEFCDQFEPLLFSLLLSLGKSLALFASGEMLADQKSQQEVEQQLTERLKASRGFWFNQANSRDALRQQTSATTWGFELGYVPITCCMGYPSVSCKYALIFTPLP